MDNDYFSIDSILAENQVSSRVPILLCFIVLKIRKRNYNARSNMIYPTWATWPEALSATYGICVLISVQVQVIYASFLKIKALSKVQIPIWLAYTIIFSFVLAHPRFLVRLTSSQGLGRL